jgi:hypothetical protein
MVIQNRWLRLDFDESLDGFFNFLSVLGQQFQSIVAKNGCRGSVLLRVLIRGLIARLRVSRPNVTLKRS